MKAIILILLSAVTLGAATWEREIPKRAGEVISINWEYPDDAAVDGFAIYRQTSLTAAPAKIATMPASSRQYDLVMPSGSTAQYRFRVMAVKGSSVSPAGPEVVVYRVK